MMCGSDEEKRVLVWISRKAKEIVSAKRIILYGSRARGDAGDRSDFDIALETDFPERLAEFCSVVEENPLTLLSFDIVNLAEVQSAFRARILLEGRDITGIVPEPETQSP
jgi:predicted nucleotidyltransferase